MNVACVARLKDCRRSMFVFSLQKFARVIGPCSDESVCACVSAISHLRFSCFVAEVGIRLPRNHAA
jgi:hypothetical protein